MIPVSITFVHGLLICIPFSLFAIITFVLNPRLWLHSLPPGIIQKARPKTVVEKSLTKYFLLPLYLVILPALSITSTVWIAQYSEASISYGGILFHLYAIWFIVHLWDFLVLDCVAVIIIDAKNPHISGATGAKGWGDIGFHIESLLKAVLFSSIFIVPVSFLLWIILP